MCICILYAVVPQFMSVICFAYFGEDGCSFVCIKKVQRSCLQLLLSLQMGAKVAKNISLQAETLVN